MPERRARAYTLSETLIVPTWDGQFFVYIMLVVVPSLDCRGWSGRVEAPLCEVSLGPSNGLLIGGWRQSAQPRC